MSSKKYIESKRKSLRNKLDSIFSKCIRSKGYCERCKITDYSKLQTSHIYSRANLSVRWDILNANCLCAGCHFWWHQNPTEGVEWLKTIYSEDKLSELRKKATTIKKWTVFELIELLNKLDETLWRCQKDSNILKMPKEK